MTIGAAIFWGVWIAICLVATVLNVRAIVQATREVRHSKRERAKIARAEIKGFEVLDGWIRAVVRLRTQGENDRFETWVIEPGHATWQRLPDMIDAPFSWGAWLTHELVAFNAWRVTEAFSENERRAP